MIPNILPKSLVDNPLLMQWVGFEGAGRVRISTGKVELGQGILTALMQIAAEELDVAPGRIDMVSGLSDESPFEGFTSGSNSTEVSGASVRLVCAEVRSLFLHGVAELLGCAVEELSVEDGRFLRDRAGTGHDYWNFADRVDLGQPARG
jgi:CO/xanthine dehydrogenase Mo-binding subunit